MDARMHYVCTKSCPECSVHMLYCVGKCEKDLCEVTDEKYMKPKDAWRDRQGSASMKRFAGLSLIPASQFVARVSLLFAFPSSAFSVL